MLKNYIKIAWRNLLKYKLDLAISIGGLAIGIACCILLVAFVRFEWSFDNFHKKSDRLFRVIEEETNPNSGKVSLHAITPYVLASSLRSTYPEIEHSIKLFKTSLQIDADNQSRSAVSLVAGRGFFEMFSFPLIAGDKNSALSSPNSVVLTPSKAQQFFGDADPIGQTLTLLIDDHEKIFQVTALAQAPPPNSSIDFEMVISMEGYHFNEYEGERAWWVGQGETWLMLHEEASANDLEEKFPEFVESHYGSKVEIFDQKIKLQPINDIYFNQEISAVFKQSNKLYSLVLAGIALVVLVIACINFVSLTLGRSSARSHEIGIRKVVGAQRMQLVGQFLGEVFVTCGLAFLVALVLAEILMPLFQQFVQAPVPLDTLNDPVLLLLLGGVLLWATLVTGGYPALILSRKKASSAFRTRTTSGKISPFVKGLIVAQFALTIIFIAMTFLIKQQLDYLFTKDLGFNSNNVITVNVGGMGNQERGFEMYRAFSQEARRLSNVKEVSGSSSLFMIHEALSGFYSISYGIETKKLQTSVNGEISDEHFLETMGIELVKGRNFSPDRPSEIENGLIINQRFVEEMGWDNPIGQTIEDKYGNFEGKKVIGVMENYHYKNLYNKLEPLALTHREANEGNGVSTILIRIHGGMLSQTLDQLAALWEKVLPGESFNYSFLDDYVRRQYEQEQRWSRIMEAASSASILLACFGLFGLSALAAQRRTKEIGIRKVFGATISSIVGLLSKDFIKLVALGFVIAVPIAWYAMNQWLADFAYRIEIGPGIFALAGGAALFIALATVSWQSVRAALANPVESLRSE